MRLTTTGLRALAALFLALVLLPASALAQSWQQMYEEDGVTVFKKDMPGMPLVAFKGETVYDQSPNMVLGVLLDNDHRIEWVGRLYTNHVIERKTDFDYVIYQAFELPAIFADRDYVYHGVATRDDKGVVTLAMQSTTHPKAPETVGVRAELINSRYVLTPLEGGTKTKVEVEIITDPKGMMPAWITNLVQKSWPVETLNGIRGQFGKDHVKPHMLPGEAEEIAAAEAAAKAAEEAEAAEDDAEGEEGEEGDADGEEGEDAAEDGDDDAKTDDAKAPAKTDDAKAPAKTDDAKAPAKTEGGE